MYGGGGGKVDAAGAVGAPVMIWGRRDEGHLPAHGCVGTMTRTRVRMRRLGIRRHLGGVVDRTGDGGLRTGQMTGVEQIAHHQRFVSSRKLGTDNGGSIVGTPGVPSRHVVRGTADDSR